MVGSNLMHQYRGMPEIITFNCIMFRIQNTTWLTMGPILKQYNEESCVESCETVFRSVLLRFVNVYLNFCVFRFSYLMSDYVPKNINVHKICTHVTHKYTAIWCRFQDINFFGFVISWCLLPYYIQGFFVHFNLLHMYTCSHLMHI